MHSRDSAAVLGSRNRSFSSFLSAHVHWLSFLLSPKSVSNTVCVCSSVAWETERLHSKAVWWRQRRGGQKMHLGAIRSPWVFLDQGHRWCWNGCVTWCGCSGLHGYVREVSKLGIASDGKETGLWLGAGLVVQATIAADFWEMHERFPFVWPLLCKAGKCKTCEIWFLSSAPVALTKCLLVWNVLFCLVCKMAALSGPWDFPSEVLILTADYSVASAESWHPVLVVATHIWFGGVLLLLGLWKTERVLQAVHRGHRTESFVLPIHSRGYTGRFWTAMALQREGFLFGWLSQLAQGERGWGGRQQGCVRLVAWEAVGRRLVGGGCRHAHREEGYIRRGAQTGEMKPFCMLGIETACCKRTWRTAGAPCRQGGGWRVLVSAVCA